MMQADFDAPTSKLSFRNERFPRAIIQGAGAWASYLLQNGERRKIQLEGNQASIHDEPLVDEHGSGMQTVIHCPANKDGIELTYHINIYAQRPFLLLRLSLVNLSGVPIRLQNFCLLQAGSQAAGSVQVPAPAGGLRFFQVGWHGWDYAGLRSPLDRQFISKLSFLTRSIYTNPVTPRSSSRGEFWSEGWGVLVGDRSALVAGFTSTAHQFGQVYANLRPGNEALMLATQMDGVRVEPGERCDSEWCYLQILEIQNLELTAEFIEATARQMKARVPTTPPPAMWTHWYQFFHNISEQVLLENLEAMADKQAVVPYQVVELDDGYQPAWGDWTSTNARFPHGLEWLAGRITEKGFTAGLWLSPFAVEKRSQLARQHPDWLVMNRHAKAARTAFVYDKILYALDLSHPAVLEYLHEMIGTITHKWGYKMLKLDFLMIGALPGMRYNPKLTRAECLRQGLEAIRQAAGEETFLLGSGCPFGPAIGIVDAMRIGPDTAPSWEPYLGVIPWAKPLVKKEVSMPAMRNATRHGLNLSTLHQRWWWNDPDCLLARDANTRLSEAEVQSAITLVGLSGGTVTTSDDMRKLSPERLRWISYLVPNLGLRGLPVDFAEREMPEIYQVKLQTGEHKWQEVAVFNWNDLLQDISIPVERLGFEPGTDLHLFDFWHRRYTRVSGAEIILRDVPPHGCRLLRLCLVDNNPQLVGDTLHISQGAEVNSLGITDGIVTIEVADLGRWVEGELWLWLPAQAELATCNGEPTPMDAHGDGIFAIQLAFLGKAKVEVLLTRKAEG